MLLLLVVMAASNIQYEAKILGQFLKLISLLAFFFFFLNGLSEGYFIIENSYKQEQCLQNFLCCLRNASIIHLTTSSK